MARNIYFVIPPRSTSLAEAVEESHQILSESDIGWAQMHKLLTQEQIMEARGRVNYYRCDSELHGFYTINLNAGTTPFVTCCQVCKSQGATSCFYRLPPELRSLAIEYAWYRPTLSELCSHDSQVIRHVLHGGLLLKPLEDASPADDQGLTADISPEDFCEFMEQIYGVRPNPNAYFPEHTLPESKPKSE